MLEMIYCGFEVLVTVNESHVKTKTFQQNNLLHNMSYFPCFISVCADTINKINKPFIG